MVWRWWMVLLAAVALVAVLVYEDRVGDEAAQPTPTQEARTPTPVPSPTPTPSRTRVKECPIPSVGQGMTLDEVRRKYNALFWRQPNVQRVRMDTVKDENGRSRGLGIIISVTEKVDQSTLPVEDLIPDCINGIPVEIRAEKWEVSG